MMHDRGHTKRMVWSLATRVGLSVSLFLLIPDRERDGLDPFDRPADRALIDSPPRPLTFRRTAAQRAA